ncbi:MAG: LCP family protein [Anaerovoracaceae bacterium]
MVSNKKKKPKEKKGTLALKLAVVLVLVLILGVGTVIGAGLTVVKNKLDNVGQVKVDEAALGIDPQVAQNLKNYRNIALLGIDARDMTKDKGTRSDAIIIASINKTTNEVKLISVYRDTYLKIDEQNGFDKITHAYAYGGATETLNSLNENMDLNIKEVMIVNWKSVADTIDALGGITIDVQDSEISEMNKYIKDTQKNIGGSKALIKKAGKQTLNGNQAVTYSRIRKDSVEGDYRRNERMKAVLAAAFEKAKTLDLSKVSSIADKILPEVKTNMAPNQMMGMLLQITSYSITGSEGWPFNTEGKMIDGVWYGPPITLKSNVVKLHEKYFKQKGYTPSKKVQDYSEQISAITGYY